MSVTVSYTGRFGNNMFQYVMGRLLAHKNKLALKPNWPHNEIIKPTVDKYWAHIYGGDIEISGFFQQACRYLPNRAMIKSWFPSYETANYKDIVIHLRADDYGKAHRIHPQWFLDILARETFEKLVIVMSPIDPEYLSYFYKYNPLVQSGGIKEDFEFIASFDKIICSNSTFCWWAAFLSNASKIYTFKKWLPDPNIDLCWSTVVDGEFWG